VRTPLDDGVYSKNILKFKNKIKRPNFSRFLLVVQFMMQIKFNINNLIFYGVSARAWQRARGTRRRRWRL